MRVYEAKLDAALAERLIALSEDWVAENSCYGYRKNTREDLADRRIFLAEDEDGILGYLFGLTEQTEKSSSILKAGARYFELEELYVIPARRSQGIGKQLFALAEESARAAGLQQIQLSTATKAWKSILHFYLDELEMEFWSARLFKRLENGGKEE